MNHFPNPDKPTLIVVDMQDGTTAGNHPATLQAVKQLILRARSNGWGIIFLEYDYNGMVEALPHLKDIVDDFGQTHSFLLELLTGYNRWAKALKPDKDGSEFVAALCEEHGFGTGQFVVCGVNLDACVVWTANGLARLFPQAGIDVVREACHSENPQMWETWKAFVAHDIIKVVSLARYLE